MSEFITAIVDGVQYVCAPCKMNGECHGCTALNGWDGNLCGKLLDQHLDGDGVGVCLRNDVIWVVDVRRDEVERLGDENKALREVLMRLRRWGMGGSFHAGVVGDLQDWIDGGMVGDLPEYPDHLPPLR